MILHCSGMDATGKSTICSNLSELLNCSVQHFDKPKDLKDGKEQYFNFLEKVDPLKNIICDRFHDGEHVYAPLYRGYESNYLEEFESKLREKPYLFVNTIASLHTIKKRIELRGEDYVKEEHYQIVLDSFEEFIEKQSMPYIKVNTDDCATDKHLIQILVAMDKVQKLYDYSVKNNCSDLYFGNVNAKNFVIVGNNNHQTIKRELFKMGINGDYWITTSNNKEFIEYQLQLFNVDKIYKF